MRKPFGIMRGKPGAAAIVVLGSTAVILLGCLDPAKSGLFPPCPVHYLTGLYCPGCGSLRAMHALLHGDLRQAWAMNPLTIMLLPFLSYGLISEICTRLLGRGLPCMTLRAGWIRSFAVAIVLFGVLRNLPFYPFNLLAPGALP